MPIVVVIPEPGWEAPLGLLDAELGRDFLKRAIAPVMIEKVVLSIVLRRRGLGSRRYHSLPKRRLS